MPAHPLFAQLSKLPQADWLKLRAKIDALHSLKSGGGAVAVAHKAKFRPCHPYYNAMVVECRRRLTWGGMAQELTDDQSLRVEQAWVDLYAAVGIRLSTAEQITLMTVAARALAEYLSYTPIPIQPRALASNADKTLVALDRQFPGYALAGMLPRVIGVDDGRRTRRR